MTKIDGIHPVEDAWGGVMVSIQGALIERHISPADVVVLLPYAQLMHEARQAWGGIQNSQTFLVPQFETTLNWSQRLGRFTPGLDDFQLNVAFDWHTARSLIKRAGLEEYENSLVHSLIDAAWSLAGLAAAIEPEKRVAWAEQMSDQIGRDLEGPVFAFELACARLALTWVGHSHFQTDFLFSADPRLLVIVNGFHREPMTLAMQKKWGDRVVVLSLNFPQTVGQWFEHQTSDAEDEAQKAASCVLHHLNLGQKSIGFIAQDRLLTRRVSAILNDAKVNVRDETGWKLSTTRAAANLVIWLRAMKWNANTDQIIDALKNAPAYLEKSIQLLESKCRKDGSRDWLDVVWIDDQEGMFTQQRLKMQKSRTLYAWLSDLRESMQMAGIWSGLKEDKAGQAVLEALYLDEGMNVFFKDVNSKINLSDFNQWCVNTLEALNFQPDFGQNQQVVLLPLAQLLGRSFTIIIFPGCDEVSLPVAPEPNGLWTARQRAVLGLPSRLDLTEAVWKSWCYLMNSPSVEVFWRKSDGGESRMPSGLIKIWQSQHINMPNTDARVPRLVIANPIVPPAALGSELPFDKLSATAYEDLRSCPYRFFALRLLKLESIDEINSTVTKKDFGNWLHIVLRIFHLELLERPCSQCEKRIELIERAAILATQECGFSESEFLPFSAMWPKVRDGYLSWFSEHEAQGHIFRAAEQWCEMPLGGIKLVGKVDRIDHEADNSVYLIDYKTEPEEITKKRIKKSMEDTQLAFYAALFENDTLKGAYVSITEKEQTKAYLQKNIVELRDELVQGIQTDMLGIKNNHPLLALGEGASCEYCSARGLCRKDFWAFKV